MSLINTQFDTSPTRGFPGTIGVSNLPTALFSRLPTSELKILFDSRVTSGKGELFWHEVLGPGATSTHVPAESSVDLTVPADQLSYAIRQTYMRFGYQPRKSQRVTVTGVLGDFTDGTVARVGYFNSSTVAPYSADYDGIWIERSNDLYFCVYRSGEEILRESRADWDDPLDGSGPSGLTLDLSANFLGEIEFEWLGVGEVDGFAKLGKVTVKFISRSFANKSGFSGAYMTSPNHSIRYEIRSVGSGQGTSTLRQICSAVGSEGGSDRTGISRGMPAYRDAPDAISVDDRFHAAIGFRLKDTHLCSIVLPGSISGIPIGNEDSRWALVRNPSINNKGTNWVDAGTSSPCEYMYGAANMDVNGQTTQAGDLILTGDVLATGYASDDTNAIDLSTDTVTHPGVSIDGTRDEFWLLLSTASGGGDYLPAINVIEQSCG
jgi:hypothetical protein